MKKNNLLGTIVSLYIILEVAPIVIGGAEVLIKVTAGGINNTVKKVIANNKSRKISKEEDKYIINVKYKEV